MTTLSSHPHREILVDWYRQYDPQVEDVCCHVDDALKGYPCEFLSGMVFLICFLIGVIYGFNLSAGVTLLFIFLAALAGLVAAWAFLFTNHGLLKQIWALAAIAGNLFFISFI